METTKPTLQNVHELFRAYDSELKKLTEEAVFESFRPIFEEFPRLLALSWHQYTPAWNDGDPCVFRMGELNVITENSIKQLIEANVVSTEDGTTPSGPISESLFHDMSTHEFADCCTDMCEEPKLLKAINSVWDLLDKNISKRIFGDNVHVIITKSKMTANEYDCGY